MNPFNKKGIKFGPTKVSSTLPVKKGKVQYPAAGVNAGNLSSFYKGKAKPKTRTKKAWRPTGPTSNGIGVGY